MQIPPSGLGQDATAIMRKISPGLQPMEIQALDEAFKTAGGLAYAIQGLKPAATCGIDDLAATALKRIAGDKLYMASLGPDLFLPQTDYLVIHAAQCRSIIQADLEGYRKIYPSASNADDVLGLIEQNPAPLMNDHRLLGSLLGYGPQNSALYQQLQSTPRGLLHEQFERRLGTVKIGQNSAFGEKPLGIIFRADMQSEETQRLITHYQQAFQKTESILRDPKGVFRLIESLASPPRQ
ncbi:MAG: hypothetical protein VKJ04_00015 [Vampirovibrionales bacterium]|nr:hypothetical protein [Vampirovibrionales bacterium]